MTISECKDYVDERNRMVRVRTVVWAGDPADAGKTSCSGLAMVRIEHPAMPGQGMVRPFEFQFPEGVEYVEAFATFDTVLQAELEKRAQAEAGRLALPNMQVSPEVMRKLSKQG